MKYALRVTFFAEHVFHNTLVFGLQWVFLLEERGDLLDGDSLKCGTGNLELCEVCYVDQQEEPFLDCHHNLLIIMVVVHPTRPRGEVIITILL